MSVFLNRLGVLVLTVFIGQVAVAQDRLAWISDPIIQAESCDKLEYENVVTFLQTYFYPTLGYTAAQRKVGRDMMANYAIASALISRSQICLAEALELKKLTDQLKKQNAVLTSGTSMSKRQLKKQRKLTAEANEKISAAAEEAGELTPDQRKTFAMGTAAYLAGTYATAQLFRSVDDYLVETKDSVSETVESTTSDTSTFGLPGLGSVKKVVGTFGTANTVTVLFRGLNDHVGDLYTTSRFLMDYSQRQNIELPADATDQLASMTDWV